jgi:hypothetical protein
MAPTNPTDPLRKASGNERKKISLDARASRRKIYLDSFALCLATRELKMLPHKFLPTMKTEMCER